MIRKFIFLFFLIILSSFVFSFSTSYTEVGGNDDTFRGETGFFNTLINLSNVAFRSRNIDEPKFVPLVADLDGDGIKEIIIVSGTQIEIYSDTDLDIIDAIDLTQEIFTPPIIMNFNVENSDLEMAFIREKAASSAKSFEAVFVNFTGGVLGIEKVSDTMESNLGGTQEIDDIIMGCDENTDCMTAVTLVDGGTNSQMVMFTFNYTNATKLRVITENGVLNRLCPSRIKKIATTDLTGDGDTDFIFSWLDFDANTGDNEVLRVRAYEFQSTPHIAGITEVWEATITLTDFLGDDTSQNCTSLNVGQYVSSPVAFEFDGFVGNGLEVIVAANNDGSDFKMYSFKSDGVFLDDYPEVFEADGVIISNPIVMDVFDDTDTVDVCVLGFDASEDIYDLLCASEQTGDIPETNEFTVSAGGVNITSGSLITNNIVHAVQMSSIIAGETNVHEILFASGVYRLIIEEEVGALSPCRLIGACSMVAIWGNPKSDSATVPIDYENIGRVDILALTATNIWYIDDGFTNSDCSNQICITEYTINPCIDTTWKENTSVVVTMTLEDVDEDVLQGRVILYHGDENAIDSGWSVNVSSGTTVSFGDMNANKSISSGTLRLVAREGQTAGINETFDFPISVGSVGVEFNDCTTSVDVSIVEEAEIVEGGETVSGNNSIINTLNTLGAQTGLGGTVLWFVIMIIVGVAMTVANKMTSSADFMMIIGVTLLMEFFMLILGFFIGVVSLAVLISVIVVSLVIIGLFISKVLVKSSAGG